MCSPFLETMKSFGYYSVPKNWPYVEPIGHQIPNTPFLPFKTPVNKIIQARYDKEYKGYPNPIERHSWTLKDLFAKHPNINVIINLCATDR